MSIVTKTGDKGETSLMYGRRVRKSDVRVEAYGCVDELTAALGVARAISDDQFIREQLFAVQKELVTVMGELATATEDRERYAKEFGATTAAMVDRAGKVIVDLEQDKSLYPKDWVIPGTTAASASLDFARTVCRRAERRVADLQDSNPEITRYLNRLSDLLWLLARYVEKQSKIENRQSKM